MSGWTSIRIPSKGLVVPFPSHWRVAELEGDSELLLLGFPERDQGQAESKRASVTVVSEDVIAHPGMALETYAQISMKTYIANDELLQVEQDITRSRISCCNQETLSFTFKFDSPGNPEEEVAPSTSLFWFSVFKFGTCFFVVNCFSSQEAFSEHLSVFNRILLDMEIDNTLLKKMANPFHGAPTMVFSSNDADLSFEIPSAWVMKATESHLAFLSLPIMSPEDTEADVKFMLSVEGPLTANNTLFSYCEVVQSSFTDLQFCELSQSEVVRLAGVPAMRSRFINSPVGDETNMLVLDVFAWICAYRDSSEGETSMQLRGVTAVFSCPVKYLPVYEEVFNEIMGTFKLYSPWKLIVEDLQPVVDSDTYDSLRSLVLYKFPFEFGVASGFQLCLPATWQLCLSDNPYREFSAHVHLETGDGFGKLKIMTEELTTDPGRSLDTFVDSYMNFLKDPENYRNHEGISHMRSVKFEEEHLQTTKIAGRDARKYLVQYEMEEPIEEGEEEGSSSGGGTRSTFSKAFVAITIRNMDVWILEFMGDKNAEVGSFDSVLPLLEKFIIPTFQLRGNAPRQDVFEAEQYRQQQLRIQENAQGASLPHGLLGTGGGRR